MKTLLLSPLIAALLTSVSAWAGDPSSPNDKATSTPYDTKPATDKSAAGKSPPAQASAGKPQSTQAAANPAKAKGTEVASKDAPDTGADENTTIEKPNQVYRFVGVRFRETWIPSFMMSLFAEGGTTVAIPAGGPEFTIRKNNFEYVFSAMFASYDMNWTPFKGKSDPPVAYELVKSQLKILYLMADFLWSTKIDQQEQFAVDYGAGLGLGLVFGDLYRNQAYPAGGNATVDPYSWKLCSDSGNPGFSYQNTPYCNNDNNHYKNYSESSWANGGSKPIIFPWLALQTGLRWKPHRQFMARLDLGWNLLNGPFVGIAANYGL